MRCNILKKNIYAIKAILWTFDAFHSVNFLI